jgi:DNA-binding transcriptional ArsR family regulator
MFNHPVDRWPRVGQAQVMDASPDTPPDHAPDPPREARLDAVFAALADPTRRAILAMLLEDDMAVTDVAAPFAMSLPAVAKHIAVLVRAGLIRQDRRGRVTWCQLDPDALREASGWMLAFGQIDAIDLDGLERFLAAELAGDMVAEAGGAAPGPPGYLREDEGVSRP